MLESINKLFDCFRKWNYIETGYNPNKSLAYGCTLGSDKERAQKLEKIYEWNYNNLRGEWNHISKYTRKGKLCSGAYKHFFVFKRKEDAVAFKIQWAE